MSDEVKKDAQVASTAEEVKTDGAVASTAKDEELDLAEELVKSLEREQKALQERDNYKQGMLKAKGKLKEQDELDEEDEEVVRKPKAERTAESSELVDVVKQLLRRNKELETAVVNKAQVSNTGQGAGSDSTLHVGDNVLSQDQVKALQAKGWDDVKITRFKQNLLRART